MEDNLILTAAMMFLSSVATLIIQWMRREKTESEADVNVSQAEKIKADAVAVLTQTISQLSQDVAAQAKTTIDYINILDTLKRDIWRLEGKISERDKQDIERVAQISALETRLKAVTQANDDLETKVASLTESKTTLESQVAELKRSSSDKDDQIELMRGRIQALETERDDLNKQIEAKESAGDNGTGAEKDAPVGEKPVTKAPEVDPQETPGGK